MIEQQRIDVLLIGTEWPTRALLRAQLIEEGFNTVAADEWPPPRELLKRDIRARLAIVDLRGMPDPQAALTEVRQLFGADHVLVIAATGTVSPEVLQQSGVHVVERPASVQTLIERTRSLLAERRD